MKYLNDITYPRSQDVYYQHEMPGFVFTNMQYLDSTYLVGIHELPECLTNMRYRDVYYQHEIPCWFLPT